VAIASDHAGFAQKQQLAAWLAEKGYPVTDFGAEDGATSVDYPDYAQLVARAVAKGQAELGVLVCGTGIGMAIAANKLPGIRAANITDPAFAVLAREHNDANVVTLSGRLVDFDTNKRIMESFLNTDFAAGRHSERLAKIAQLEQ
jgi:ribose 5-phosphate isomerase B